MIDKLAPRLLSVAAIGALLAATPLVFQPTPGGVTLAPAFAHAKQGKDDRPGDDRGRHGRGADDRGKDHGRGHGADDRGRDDHGSGGHGADD